MSPRKTIDFHEDMKQTLEVHLIDVARVAFAQLNII
jgi:hypothetical protein